MRRPLISWNALLLANRAEDLPRRRPGLRIAEHWVLSWCRSGTGRVLVDDTACTLQAGDLLLTPPQTTPVLCGEQGPWQRIWCAFRSGTVPVELSAWGTGHGPLRRLHLPPGADRARIDRLMREIVDLHLGPPLPDREGCCLSLLQTVLRLARGLDRSSSHSDPELLPALAAMRHHLHRPLSVAGLARRCGLSSSRFAHRFTAAMGTSPMRHLEDLRLDQARHLLRHSDEPITHIARRCGWPSPEHFARLFRRRCGCTPSAYRREL